jgi:hypothetical protein
MAESQETSSNLSPVLASLNIIRHLKDAKADSETPSQYFHKVF